MITRILAPLFLAGAAIAMAPTAYAGSTATCDSNGPVAVCSRPGHAAIFATPPQDLQQFSIVPGPGNPFGSGLMPPLIAMN